MNNYEQVQHQANSSAFEAEPSAFEPQLQAFKELFNLPDELVDAYRPERISVHSCGLTSSDERLAAELEPGLALGLKYTLERHRKIYDAPLATTVTLSQASNRRGRRLVRNKTIRKESERDMLHQPSYQPWIETLAEKARDGIWGQGSCSAILQQTELTYLEGYNWWEITDETPLDFENGTVKPSDLLAVFLPGEIEQGVTVKALSERLRERNLTDLSKEALDARFDHLLANLQIESMIFLVDAIHDMANPIGIGENMREVLQRFLQTHEGRFAVADLNELASMIAELRATTERHIGGSSSLDKQLSLVIKRTHTALQQLSYTMHGFEQIYGKLGYDLPAFLQQLESPPKPTPTVDLPLEVAAKPQPTDEREPTFQSNEEAELQALADAILQDIHQLERPYKYTSSKIRAFEGGTKLVHDLEIELAEKRLLSDQDAVQALGILICQSQQEGLDKTEYLVKLLDAQAAIEALLRDLGELTPTQLYRAPLVDALHWLDEVVESGDDSKIRNEPLQTLIYDYCIGPEVEAAGTDEPAKQPLTPESIQDVEVPISERSIADMQRVKLQTARRRAHEIYGKVLSDILDKEEIEFVDVIAAAATPGKRVHRATRSRQNEATYADIDPERLLGLIRLRDQLRDQGKLAELKFIRGAQNQKYPPFILYVQRSSDTVGGVCVLENPVVGYSSRIYPLRPELTTDDWRQIITLSYAELTELGLPIQTKIHKPKGSPIFDQHYTLELLNLINLNLPL